jgi:hypothetical protein
MYSLLVLVLDNTELLHDVLQAWEDAGVPGATVLESTGLRRVTDLFGRDDMPLVPSLRDLSERKTDAHRTIFCVLDDEAIVENTIVATERVVGDLSLPHTGILFVVPVSRVVGGQMTHH